MPVRSGSKLGRKPIRSAGDVSGDGDSSKNNGSERSPKKRKKRRKGKKRAYTRRGSPAPPAAPASGSAPVHYSEGFVDGEWQGGGVRGRVFICGTPGSGKSELLVRRVRGCARAIVFDPIGAETIAQLLGDGFVAIHQPGELRDHLAQNFDGSFRVLYTPKEGDGLKHFEAVNQMVKFCGRMVYAIDEVDKHQSPGFAPQGLYDLLNYGRHHEVALIGTARRSVNVAKDFTFNLSEICAFRFSEPVELRYFENKCGPEMATVIPSLSKYEYARWIEGGPAPERKVGWNE